MALRPILVYPDPRLREVAKEVTKFDAALKELADDMFDTMYEDHGVGLAATQVNVQRRVIVLDVSLVRNEPRCIVNPKILEARGHLAQEEGCLSFPGVFAAVLRAQWIRCQFFDEYGNEHTVETDGLLAKCILHEIDHLDGILFVDHLSSLKRQLLLKKLKKLQRKSL